VLVKTQIEDLRNHVRNIDRAIAAKEDLVIDLHNRQDEMTATNHKLEEDLVRLLKDFF